jgi:hypothetical protein
MDTFEGNLEQRYHMLPSGSARKAMDQVVDLIENDPVYTAGDFRTLTEQAMRRDLAQHRQAGGGRTAQQRQPRSSAGTKLTHDGASTTTNAMQSFTDDDFDAENGVTIGMFVPDGGSGL